MKNIVLCFDGTGNFFGDHLTNPAKIDMMCIDNNSQIVGYEPGVGNFSIFQSLRSTYDFLLYLFGGAFGWGVISSEIEAYRFLMNVYEPGDLIFIFGFSRGAYIARSLCGMLHKCGLLHKENNQLLSQVQDIYYKKDNEEDAEQFKEGLTQVCVPHFLGLFDTVNSRGQLTQLLFPMDVALHPDITYAYHAISIDEKRRFFQPLLLNESLGDKNQIVEQIWFAGCHCDIGGFFTDDAGLSDITLKWMLEKASEQGLQLKERFSIAKLKPNIGGCIHESYTGLWKLLGKKVRVIPENSKVHQSVFARAMLDPNYTPSNIPYSASSYPPSQTNSQTTS